MALTQIEADAICAAMIDGESLRSACEMLGVVRSTFFRALADPARQDLRDQYARAMQARTEAMAHEIEQIADDGSRDTYQDAEGNVKVDHDVIARSRLRVDTRKWLMSKLQPKKYGDKLDVDANVAMTVEIVQFSADKTPT